MDALIDVAVRERAKVVVLNSPNNPTGSVVPPGAVERVLAETGALVLCDEAYVDFGGPDAMEALTASNRVVVLRTFSKALGMAGLRFGVALAHPAVAREIAKAKLPYNVNLFTLTAAEVALEHMDVRRDLVARIIATRDRAFPRLGALPGITVYPSAGNFFSAVPFRDAERVFQRLLREHDILVRDVSAVPGLSNAWGSRWGRMRTWWRWKALREILSTGEVSEVRRVRWIGLRNFEGDEGDADPRAHRPRWVGRGEREHGHRFFDHMLDAFARHGLFDLTVEAKGDLQVDGHHTVEDTGIALGQAIAMALGDRAGSGGMPMRWCRSTKRWCARWWTCRAGRTCPTRSRSPSGSCWATTTSSSRRSSSARW
jgi:hypothetical protein